MTADPPLPARWLVVGFRAPPRGQELLVADAMTDLGARVLERDGERLRAYFVEPDDPEGLVRDVEARLRAHIPGEEPEVSWAWESPRARPDLWAPGLEARRITDRLAVVPADGPTEAPGGASVVIRIRPGLGFGTAEHPTTRACLLLLDPRVKPGSTVLDLGAGSGILSVAAALLGARRVLALEADAHACAAARGNAELNEVAGRIDIREHEVRPGDLAGRVSVDGVLANLVPPILLPLLPDVAEALSPGGWLVTAGASVGERAGFLRAAAGAGFGLDEERTDEGWWSAAWVRREAGRPGDGGPPRRAQSTR